MSQIRTRWAAVGAAVAVTLGAGGIGLVDAAKEDGDRAVYTAITTCRLVDTRSEPEFNIGDRATPLGEEETVTLDVWADNGECTGIPDDVVSVQLNVTAVNATQSTHLTVWPDGDVPNGSSLNPTAEQSATPNAVSVDLSDAGSFNIYNFRGEVDVIVDLVGVFQDHVHDDRYYTEEEVDAVTDELWGHWLGGVLAAASDDTVTVEDPNGATEGVFCVLVPERDTLHGFQVTSGTPGLIAAVDPHDAGGDCAGLTVPDGQTAVAVFFEDNAGVATDGDFTFFAPASGPAPTTTTTVAP